MRLLLLLCVSFLIPELGIGQEKRTLTPADYYRIPTVAAPDVSPDGQWVVYTLSTPDSASDKISPDVWMVSVESGDTIKLTNNTASETQPQFSPDGRYISFLSARDGGSAQVWLLDRRGGEARKLTEEKREISFYSWSPDSRKLLLVMKDSLDTTQNNKRRPYVINRYRFKQDVEGYRYDTRKTHLYTFDVASKKVEQLTSGNYNESQPAWSPSGLQIVFVSNRTEDPDRNRNTDLWMLDVESGSPPKQLTTWAGSDEQPALSPDVNYILYVRSTSDANSEYYEQPILAITRVDGDSHNLLSLKHDRPVFNPRWSRDSKSIAVLIADDTRRYVGLFDLQGNLKELAGGDRSFTQVEAGSNDIWIATMSEPWKPTELYSITNGEVKQITHVHDRFMANLNLSRVEKFQSKSKDGTLVSGLLYHPPGINPGQKLPLVFYLHGGPVSQDEFSFDLTRQILAAHGFLTAAVNYRGSSGRGHKYSHTISGEWGHKEVADILGAADHLVKQGSADATRIGISGWSYGGMLTTYSIASDTRFKAAVSGAGVAFPLALYGVDEYIMQYDNEIGPPWKKGNLEKYMRISYPFLKADRIKTPTLFMGGDKDFNVPLSGSEQMYQALRSLGKPTELVVYPNQYHGLTQPSFIVDRFERHIKWFNKYLK